MFLLSLERQWLTSQAIFVCFIFFLNVFNVHNDIKIMKEIVNVVTAFWPTAENYIYFFAIFFGIYFSCSSSFSVHLILLWRSSFVYFVHLCFEVDLINFCFLLDSSCRLLASSSVIVCCCFSSSFSLLISALWWLLVVCLVDSLL